MRRLWRGLEGCGERVSGGRSPRRSVGVGGRLGGRRGGPPHGGRRGAWCRKHRGVGRWTCGCGWWWYTKARSCGSGMARSWGSWGESWAEAQLHGGRCRERRRAMSRAFESADGVGLRVKIAAGPQPLGLGLEVQRRGGVEVLLRPGGEIRAAMSGVMGHNRRGRF